MILRNLTELYQNSKGINQNKANGNNDFFSIGYKGLLRVDTLFFQDLSMPIQLKNISL